MPPTTRQVASRQAQQQFSRILDDALAGRETVVLRNTRPVAVVMSMEKYREWETAMAVTVYPAQINETQRREFPARALADIAQDWTRGDILLAIRLLADAVTLTAAEAQVKLTGDHK